jgi:nitrite reductase (NO-forming)
MGPPIGPPIRAILTSPPNVPAPIHRSHPAKVIVELETRDVKKEMPHNIDLHGVVCLGGGAAPRFIRDVLVCTTRAISS